MSIFSKDEENKPKQRHRLLVNPQELGLTARIKTALLQQDMGITQRIKKAVGRKIDEDVNSVTAKFKRGDVADAMASLHTKLSLIFLLPFLIFGEIVFQGLVLIQDNKEIVCWVFTIGTWCKITVLASVALLWCTIVQYFFASRIVKKVSKGRSSINDYRGSIIMLNLMEYLQPLTVFLIALSVSAIMLGITFESL